MSLADLVESMPAGIVQCEKCGAREQAERPFLFMAISGWRFKNYLSPGDRYLAICDRHGWPISVRTRRFLRFWILARWEKLRGSFSQ